MDLGGNEYWMDIVGALTSVRDGSIFQAIQFKELGTKILSSLQHKDLMIWKLCPVKSSFQSVESESGHDCACSWKNFAMKLDRNSN